MTLQFNADGHLIYHICNTTFDPNGLNHLMSDCCCECLPDLQDTYTITWQQLPDPFSTQSFFWSDYYGYIRCNVFNDQSPFDVTYQDACSWRSPNFAVNPGPSQWTWVYLGWSTILSEWEVRESGGAPPFIPNRPLQICNNGMRFLGYPDPIDDACNPRGSYRCTTWPIMTDDAYGPGSVGLEIELTIS